jgi:hypothetical protein
MERVQMRSPPVVHAVKRGLTMKHGMPAIADPGTYLHLHEPRTHTLRDVGVVAGILLVIAFFVAQSVWL